MINIVNQKTFFKQQKLPSWKPIITVKITIPICVGIGGLFIFIGTVILCTNNNVKEKVIYYSSDSECLKCEESITIDKFMNGTPIDCKCNITFNLQRNWDDNVFFYYELTNFYQNVRRFATSRDHAQLRGELSQEVDLHCRPFDKIDDGTPIAPCGAVANSMFTDVFEIEYISSNGGKAVPLSYKNIAWESDKTKFRNPKDKSLKEAFAGFAKPKQWTKNIYELDLNDPENNGFQNQDFMVWMQPAAFTPFRKLYRRLDRNREAVFRNGLPRGQYKLNIQYNYPIRNIGGKKIFMLTTTSWLGGRNATLGVGYVVVGCVFLALGALLFYLIQSMIQPDYCEEMNQ